MAVMIEDTTFTVHTTNKRSTVEPLWSSSECKAVNMHIYMYLVLDSKYLVHIGQHLRFQNFIHSPLV